MNIVVSNEIVETDVFQSSKQIVGSMDSHVSDDLKWTGASGDGTGGLVSVDVVDSMNIVVSNEIVETDVFQSSKQFVGSIESCRAVVANCSPGSAAHEFSALIFWRTARFDRPCIVSSVLSRTGRFSMSSQFHAPLTEGQKSTVVLISIAGSLAAVLLIVTGIVVLLGCRRLSFSSPMSLTEPETEVLTDSQLSFNLADPFLSEQNALSSGRWIE
jgi:predicted RNA-binding protein